MGLEAVLFDLGGTLIYDSKSNPELWKCCHQSLTSCLVSKGLDVKLDDVLRVSNSIYEVYPAFSRRSLVELDARVIYSSILYQLGVVEYTNEDLISHAVNAFHAPIVEVYQIFGDVKETLDTLKHDGFKLGLVTNNHSVDFHFSLLQKFGLGRFFDAVVVSSKLGIRKPHKAIFLECVRNLDVSIENSIFVGDEPFDDVLGAKKAGMRCIWVKRIEHADVPAKPDWIVESIKEAYEVISSQTS